MFRVMLRPMKKPAPRRRRPRQLRAQHTVEAVLDAVARVLKREGISGVTTNRIAQVAGVSIGSVYQYFPDKHAIFLALRERHSDAMARLFETKLLAHAGAPLDTLLTELLDAMIEAHALDPALHDLLLSQVPHASAADRDVGQRMHTALRLALAARVHEFSGHLAVDNVAFVLAQLLESLAHAVVLRRPATLSLTAGKAEALRAVLGYLDAHGRKRPRSSRRP